METTITKEEFYLLRDFIEKECGITLEEEKMYLIESRLAGLVIETGCKTFSEFYLKVKEDINPILRDKIVDAMTTNETLWFRDEGPFTILKDIIFPEMLAKLESSQKYKINIWSAACSTGQEPYSIAITALELAREKMKEWFPSRVSILATDVSSSALMIAKNARYNPIAIARGLSSEHKDRYFEQQGPVWTLNDEVKKMVEFKQFNLQKPFKEFGQFDIIMLRNVAIYFSHEFKVELFKKIAEVLTPGGYLFLGSSETLLGYNDVNFRKFEHCRHIYYQLKN